jgi:hypothetical protein|tara:strand:+ start:688 stop:1011 length:324 start_codon:yes stop_codon:yes gene_type:complete
MKFVEEDGFQKPKNEEHSFDKRGAKVTGKKEIAFSKKIDSHSGQVNYCILTYQSLPLDPWGMYKGRESTLDTKMKSVSKQTFDYYMLFLKTRNSLYLTRAQRGFIND